MKHRKTFILVTLVAVLWIAYGFQDPSGYKILFEKAKYTMETKGDLNGAIALFNDIIKKYPKEREYAAKSQLYVGLCYEKLGVKEAEKAYQKVVSSYPEQTETVKLANEKLSLLLRAEAIAGKGNKEFSIRRVKEGIGIGVLGEVSPDGRYLSYADEGSLDLAIYEIATGKKRILVKGNISSDAYYSRWSPDGRLVAYEWWLDGKYDLRVVGLDGTKPRVLYSNADVKWLDPQDWSPDGKNILTILSLKDRTYQMVLVSVQDGSVRMLKNFDERTPGRSRFSPDGRYIAYTYQQHPESGKQDIFVLPLDGGNETALVQDPADDGVLDWTPDGKGILFSSDRTGTVGVWWIQVIEGKSHGTPELLKPDLGPDFIPMGFTRNGSYYYGTQKEMKDVFIAELDLVTGKLISAPSLATRRFAGSNYCSSWSTDGQELLYLSQRAPGDWGARTICVRSTESGEVRELFSKLNKLAWVGWSPDGRSLCAAAQYPPGEFGVFRIDVQTGDFKFLLKPHIGWPAAWSRDGKAMFSYLSDSIGNRIPIVMQDLETGREKELYSLTFSDSSYYSTGLALSCDGLQLAFSVSESGSRIIKVIPVVGGEVHELLRLDESLMPVAFGTIAWAPDGRSVLFIRSTSPGGSKTELWLVPLKGGEPRKLELTADNMHDLSVHPDGRHIAFTAGKPKSEVWVMENFLPKEKIEVNNQLTFRKLDYAQLNYPYAEISPDGKKIAYYIAGQTKQGIGILDPASGTAKVIIESGAGGQASKVWSPKSDKIAYRLNDNEIHIYDFNEAKTQLFYKSPEYRLYPTDWSKDGNKIVCFFEAKDRTLRIGTIMAGGQVKILASGNQAEFVSEPKFSPEGNYIAFSRKDEKGNSDIFILASDGSKTESVAPHPGRDECPVWSPDGKYLFFLSDRNRSTDLWGIRINQGKSEGAPFIIKRDLGWRTLIQDITSDGKLFMLTQAGGEPANLFTILLDKLKGSIDGPVTPVSVFPTDHSFPRFSPDGKMIAYLSRRSQIGYPRLFVMDEKGAERELPLQGHFATNIAWHPENNSLFFTGWDKTQKTGVFEVSLANEEIKLVYCGDTVDMKTGKGRLVNINLIPDAGKMMFFKLLEGGYVEVLACMPDGLNQAVVIPRVKMPMWGIPTPDGYNICYRLGDSLMVISVSDKTPRHIGSSTVNLEATWSPNGEILLFREGSDLRAYSVKGKVTHTLYQAPAGKTIGGMEMYAPSWSPDGSRFIFTERDTSAISTSPQKLILINPADGSYKTVGEAPEGYRLSELRWSPDGNKVVATGKSITSAKSPMYEYWVLENFLPK